MSCSFQKQRSSSTRPSRVYFLSSVRAYPGLSVGKSARFTWTAMPDGWAIRLCWPRSTLPLDATGALYFELVVNERPPDRERRRGQLVLSGGGGFGYLMGNRRPTSRFVRLVIP